MARRRATVNAVAESPAGGAGAGADASGRVGAGAGTGAGASAAAAAGASAGGGAGANAGVGAGANAGAAAGASAGGGATANAGAAAGASAGRGAGASAGGGAGASAGGGAGASAGGGATAGAAGKKASNGGGTGAERDAARGPNVVSAARYLAWLYTPAPQQPGFAALCEIESEVAASLRPGIDHHVAHARLQWWRDEAERSARGQGVHPLTRQLAKAFPNDGSRLADISGFVDTAVWDLASATFEGRKELTAYCERWAAAMFEPAVALAAAHPVDRSAAASVASTAPERATTEASSAASPWRTLGAAIREIELLANLAPEAHAGRLRVPLDELERAGVDPTIIPKPPWPAPVAALLVERYAALRAVIAKGVAAVGSAGQASSRGLMVWAALAWRMSLRAEGALPGMIAPRRYHAFADGWQAWRAARRATTGTLWLG